MMEEELIGGNSNPASIHYMSEYTMAVIGELQQGKKNKINEFEMSVYRNVKQFKG